LPYQFLPASTALFYSVHAVDGQGTFNMVLVEQKTTTDPASPLPAPHMVNVESDLKGSITGVRYVQGQHYVSGSYRGGSAVAVKPHLQSQRNSGSSSIVAKERIWSYAPAVKLENRLDWARHAAESALLESAKSGDTSAFGELSEQCRAPLFSIARRILRDEADAQDSVQDSLLKAFVNLTRFDGRSTFLTWATRITINCCLMRLRRRRKHQETHVEVEVSAKEPKEMGGTQRNPEQAVREDEEKRLLHLAIDALPEKLRRVVEIKELQDRTTEEAASLLGISVMATKTRLFRAKALLKRLVTSEQCLRRLHSTGSAGRSCRTNARLVTAGIFIRGFRSIYSGPAEKTAAHKPCSPF
jgi:RNA polymerase sigma-70 factor (ECF subfamily)